MLLYIHIIFSRTPITCLDHIKEVWPRDGIVRIDITRGAQEEQFGSDGYSLHQSYAKEERIHQREQFEYQAMFGFFGGSPRLQWFLFNFRLFHLNQCTYLHFSTLESAESSTESEEANTVEIMQEVYYNDTLTSNIASLGNDDQNKSPLPTQITELDKIIRAGIVIAIIVVLRSNPEINF